MREHPELAAASSAAVILTGVQGIVPALPGLQRALELDDAGISLIMLVYVLAAAVAGIPAGALADRVGTRPVLSAALMAFGVVAVVPVLFPDVWLVLLSRTIQGASFGVALSISASVLADRVNRARQAGAQSRRVVVMTSAEAVLPLAAGILVASTDWRSAFLLGLLAIPIAVLCWFTLKPGKTLQQTTSHRSFDVAVRAVLSRDGLGVQSLGFVRFLLKFGALSFLPILADRSGLGPAGIGLAFSVGAFIGIIVAAVTPLLMRRAGLRLVLVAAVILGAGPFVAAVAVVERSIQSAVVVIGIVVITTIGDALLGVTSNVVAAHAAPAGARATFMGITTTVRNAGKFAAPAAVAVLVLAMPLSSAVALLGAICLLGLAGVPGAVRASDAVDSHMRSDPS